MISLSLVKEITVEQEKGLTFSDYVLCGEIQKANKAISECNGFLP